MLKKIAVRFVLKFRDCARSHTQAEFNKDRKELSAKFSILAILHKSGRISVFETFPSRNRKIRVGFPIEGENINS